MKKTLLKTTILASVVAVSHLSALDIEVGGGIFGQTPTGSIAYSDTTTGFNGSYISKENKDTSIYVYTNVKNNIDYLPNLKLQYVDTKDSGSAKGDFKDFNTGGISVEATTEMKQYDVIPYYTIVKDFYKTEVDLGIDIKIVDASYEANGVNIIGVGNGNYSDSQLVALPMAYVKIRGNNLLQNISAEVEAKYVTYSGSSVYDVTIKADYGIKIYNSMKMFVEAGYRMQNFNIEDDGENTTMDMSYGGYFAGVSLHF